MKGTVKVKHRFRIPGMAGAVLLLGLAQVSCTVAPTEYEPVSHDYRLRHNLEVTPVVARVGVEFAKDETSVPAAAAVELEKYFAAYLRSGRGLIEMTAYEDGSTASILRDRIASMEAFARDQGVRRSEVSGRIGEARNDGRSLVEIAFRSHVVRVPECGDWTRDNLQSFDNAQLRNFGCATNANLGKMVADPGDLVRRRDASDPDTPSVLRVIGRHQAGETPSSADNPAGPASALGATQ